MTKVNPVKRLISKAFQHAISYLMYNLDSASFRSLRTFETNPTNMHYYLIFLFSCLLAASRLSAQTIPDDNFGVNGQVTLDFQSDDKAKDAVPDDNGGLFLGGYISGSHQNFAIVHLLPDGSPDPEFADNGLFTVDFNGTDDEAEALTRQSNGTLVIAGHSAVETQRQWSVARVGSNGIPDPSFGVGGLVSMDITPQDDRAFDVLSDATGNLFLFGGSGESDLTVVKLLPTGAPDPRFGDVGIARHSISDGEDWAFSGALQPDGKILAAGYILENGTRKLFCARLNPDGSLDTTFNKTGVFQYRFPNDPTIAWRMLLRNNGHILLTGQVNKSVNNAISMVQLLPSGLPDNDFKNSGAFTLFLGNGDASGVGLMEDQDGNILLGARMYNGTDTDFALLKLDSLGNLSGSFGDNGAIAIDFGGFDDLYNLVWVAPNKLALVGAHYNGLNFDMAAAMMVTDLSLGVTDANRSPLRNVTCVNPVTEELQLHYTLQHGGHVRISLFSPEGREVFSHEKWEAPGENQFVLNTPDYPGGVYHLVLTYRGQKSNAIKLLFK